MSGFRGGLRPIERNTLVCVKKGETVMKAIHTRLAVATALMSLALVSGSIDDVFGQSVPSVSTYATGLTNPRGLAFGPDGNLYVAEAGTGGSQTPADIDPSCPVMVNVFSPFTAGYSGRVTRVLADGTTETVAEIGRASCRERV